MLLVGAAMSVHERHFKKKENFVYGAAERSARQICGFTAEFPFAIPHQYPGTMLPLTEM